MVGLIAISLVAYTAVALLFKAAAAHTQANRLVLVAISVVALASATAMLIHGEWGGTWIGALIALLAGALFYAASLCRVKALATTPVSLVFALTNLDLVISGAIALFLPMFGQNTTGWRVFALVIAAGAVLVGTQIRGIEHISPYTFASLGLLSLSAFGFVLYARLFPTALLFFILLDHLAGLLLQGSQLRAVRRNELMWGAALGIAMFVGFWSLLQALAASPNITLVLLILSMKTPIIALAAIPMFREGITRNKLAAVGLATLALMLWEIG